MKQKLFAMWDKRSDKSEGLAATLTKLCPVVRLSPDTQNAKTRKNSGRFWVFSSDCNDAPFLAHCDQHQDIPRMWDPIIEKMGELGSEGKLPEFPGESAHIEKNDIELTE
jgi:hypothetical protein